MVRTSATGTSAARTSAASTRRSSDLATDTSAASTRTTSGQSDPERTRQEGRSPPTGPVGDPTPHTAPTNRHGLRRRRLTDPKGPVPHPWEVRPAAPTPAQRWYVRARQARARQEPARQVHDARPI